MLYTSFSYLEKPVLGMKEGKSVTRSREKKGRIGMRKVSDEINDLKVTLHGLGVGLHFFPLKCPLSSSFLCSFHGLHDFSQSYCLIYLVYPPISPWILVSLLQCSFPQHLLHGTENNNVQPRGCFSDGGIEVILR